VLQTPGIFAMLAASKVKLDLRRGLTPQESKPQDMGSWQEATTL